MAASACIHTDRLILRPRTLEDIGACMAMDRDPEVTKYITGPWGNPGEHRAFLEERMTKQYTYPFGYWTITFAKNPGQFLGWVMLLSTDDTLLEAEVGWRLARAAWGKGIGTEATLGVLGLLAKHSPETKVFAEIHSDNAGSTKVAKKIGMRFSGEHLQDGVTENIYWLGAP